jgi:hypothetical protein
MGPLVTRSLPGANSDAQGAQYISTGVFACRSTARTGISASGPARAPCGSSTAFFCSLLYGAPEGPLPRSAAVSASAAARPHRAPRSPSRFAGTLDRSPHQASSRPGRTRPCARRFPSQHHHVEAAGPARRSADAAWASVRITLAVVKRHEAGFRRPVLQQMCRLASRWLERSCERAPCARRPALPSPCPTRSAVSTALRRTPSASSRPKPPASRCRVRDRQVSAAATLSASASASSCAVDEIRLTTCLVWACPWRQSLSCQVLPSRSISAIAWLGPQVPAV